MQRRSLALFAAGVLLCGACADDVSGDDAGPTTSTTSTTSVTTAATTTTPPASTTTTSAATAATTTGGSTSTTVSESGCSVVDDLAAIIDRFESPEIVTEFDTFTAAGEAMVSLIESCGEAHADLVARSADGEPGEWLASALVVLQRGIPSDVALDFVRRILAGEAFDELISDEIFVNAGGERGPFDSAALSAEVEGFVFFDDDDGSLAASPGPTMDGRPADPFLGPGCDFPADFTTQCVVSLDGGPDDQFVIIDLQSSSEGTPAVVGVLGPFDQIPPP